MKKTFLNCVLLLCALVAGSQALRAESVTYTYTTQTSVTTTGTAPAGSSVVFSAPNSSGRIGAGDAQILTLKGYLGYKITALTLNMISNTKSGGGSLSYSVDGGDSYTYIIGSSSAGVSFSNAEWYGSWPPSDYVDVTKSPLDIVCGASDVIIRIKGTENSLYCRSYTLTYTTGTITPVTNVSLDKSWTTITCGGTETLTPTVSPVDASNKLVTWTSSNALVASVEDGVVTANALGTATITATTVDQEFTASCEVTVTEDASRPVLTGVLLEEDFSDGYNFRIDRGWQCSEHGEISVGGYKLGGEKGGGSLVTPALSAEAGTALLTFKVRGYEAGEQAIYLSGTNCTLSPTSFTDLSATTLESKEVTVTFTGANPKITFETRGTAYRAFVDDIVVTMTGNTVDVTLNASGFASYCSRYALDLTPTTSLAAYTVKAIGGTAIKLTKINGKVAARTPFILYNPDAPSTTVNIPVIADDDSGIAAVTDNALVGTTSPTYVEAASGYTNFGLSGSKFVGMNDGVVRANKAYLPVSNEVLGTAAHAFDIVITDPTAISTVAADSPAAGACYTLSGLRVANPTRGLYIVNGRKIIVK